MQRVECVMAELGGKKQLRLHFRVRSIVPQPQSEGAVQAVVEQQHMSYCRRTVSEMAGRQDLLLAKAFGSGGRTGEQ